MDVLFAGKVECNHAATKGAQFAKLIIGGVSGNARLRNGGA